MYDKKFISVTSQALDPLSQTVTPSRTLSPSSVTYFMDGPLSIIVIIILKKLTKVVVVYNPKHCLVVYQSQTNKIVNRVPGTRRGSVHCTDYNTLIADVLHGWHKHYNLLCISYLIIFKAPLTAELFRKALSVRESPCENRRDLDSMHLRKTHKPEFDTNLQGPPSPLRPWCFPPVSDFPLFSKNVQTLWTIFQILPFPEKCVDFIRQNFWWPFLFIDHKIWISPLFSLFQYISPYFAKIIIPPSLTNVPPFFEKLTCFLHTLCVGPISFPPTLTMMHLCITQCT